MTGHELVEALTHPVTGPPKDALRCLVSVDLAPGIWADVRGIRYSGGHTEGWRIQIQLGAWHIAPAEERT